MGKYLCLFDRDMTTWNRDGATRNSYNASYYNYYATKQYGGIYGDIPATSLTVGNRYYAHIILSESNNKKTRVQVRMDVNTFNMDDTCSSSDDTRCSQCFDLASGDDFRFLFVQSTATSGWGNTNVKEAYLIDVTEDTEGMTLAEAKTWCDANIETSQVVDTVEELTEEYETSITNSIGYQSSITLSNTKSVTLTNSIGNQDAIVISKSISSELNSSIGNQDNLVLSKNIDTTILSSMGQQMVLDFTKATTLTIGSSIAEQYSSVVTKNIDEELSSSIGDKYAYTYTTAIDTDDFEVEILGSIGEQHNLASYKNIDVELASSIGNQDTLEYSLANVTRLASSIGFNQVIDFTKASSNSITHSIGFNESYSYSSSAGLKTTSITNSIGVQENIGYSKSISSVISSVIEQHYEQDYSKNTLLQCNNSIGFIYSKLGNKDTSSTLLSSIGFNYRIRNVYPYIASEDFYLTKDENNTSVSGETNNFNLVGQKNNFNLVGTRNINNLIGERSKYDI